MLNFLLASNIWKFLRGKTRVCPLGNGRVTKVPEQEKESFQIFFYCTKYILHILNPDIFTRASFLLQSDWKQNFSCFQNIFDFGIFYLPFFCLLISCKRCWFRYRGERILFFGPNRNTNIIRNQNFDRIRIQIIFVFSEWENTNTNNIRAQIFGRIRIQIIFGFRIVPEYEYE